jgi:hypothetical protein
VLEWLRAKSYLALIPVIGVRPPGGQAKIENNQIRLMLTSFAYRGHSIDGEEGILVVGLEQDVISETHVGVVVNDKNFFVTQDRLPVML